MTATPETPAAIRTEELEVRFPLRRRSPFAKPAVVHAVDGVSITVRRGTTFGIVGESGSGKTTTALAIMRLQEATGGRIWIDGEDITERDGPALRELRKRIQIIFQDPYSSLNPRRRVGAAVREPLDLIGIGDAAWRDRHVAELFERVGLQPEHMSLFPHQFSGGQRQRIGIARALATRPAIVVCDEPVSALDVAIQAQILNLMRELKQEFGLTYLFISHNLGIVQRICDEVAVMYLGRVVEQADRHTLFARPQHPYTKALIAAVPRVEPAGGTRSPVRSSAGEPPSPVDLPPGCRFASRCPLAQPRCHAEAPVLRAHAPGHQVACHLVD
ncbi:ATP-binding cassette domain-containing protein [Aquibium sp. A9E412]|uniref:ABC transporter ATP-binding protein n=1 Tax=Aquibium sp. A9E412 TaxID=2976767 RepID=UPI0025AF381F|nr:oligopeptide/dipeptide ABC transporter ATP-binding protein [Aquibium sp. A9E412]MDN2566119.1 ATP-binding cassette domain-containing protein [Aquibium sp. A9E412]